MIELLKEDRGDRKLSFGQFGATFLLRVILLFYSVLKDLEIDSKILRFDENKKIKVSFEIELT